MSHIPKRFISHATLAAKLYTSKRGKIVKAYLEQEGLKDWAAKTKGVDDAGAESAEVVAPGHEGGTVPSEPFHIDVQVKDAHGKIIQTENPHTKRPTNTWHVYIAKDKNDLYNLAKAWYEKHSGEHEPHSGENKPHSGENKPHSGENKPHSGENKPHSGGNKPHSGGHK